MYEGCTANIQRNGQTVAFHVPVVDNGDGTASVDYDYETSPSDEPQDRFDVIFNGGDGIHTGGAVGSSTTQVLDSQIPVTVTTTSPAQVVAGQDAHIHAVIAPQQQSLAGVQKTDATVVAKS